MTRSFENGVAESGPNPTRIEEGRISNVNMARWTADVKTRESQRTYYDIQWSSPYFHFAAGEGMFFMPEVGAKVKVCRPADSDPFIMCFVTAYEREGRQTDSDSGEQPQAGAHSTEPTGDEEDRSDITYRAGRPYLQQGDMMIRTRDGNGIWFRRGGVLEVFSTAIAKRLYIPLLNYIRDICENYDLQSAGGRLHWNVSRSDEDSDDESPTVLTLTARDKAQDDLASVLVRVGHVPDENKLRIAIAPRAINPRTLEISGDAVYTLDLSDDGKKTEFVKDDYDLTVEGECNWEVTGDVTIRSAGFTQEVSGDASIQVSGEHSLRAASSTENISGSKTINSNSIDLGGGSRDHVVIATAAFKQFVLGHRHDSPAGPTLPPTAAPPAAAYTARKVKGS